MYTDSIINTSDISLVNYSVWFETRNKFIFWVLFLNRLKQPFLKNKHNQIQKCKLLLIFEIKHIKFTNMISCLKIILNFKITLTNLH